MRLILVFAAIVAWLPAASAESGIPEYVEWEFFELSVEATERFVDLSTSDQPLSYANTRFRGSTEWRLQWDYRPRDEVVRCSVDKVMLTLRIRHSLPVLPKKDLPDNAAELFAPVYKALHAHEQRHATHARAAARDVDRVMRMLPTQESCDILEKRLRVLVGGVLDDYKARDEKLDADTDFGWKQVPEKNRR